MSDCTISRGLAKHADVCRYCGSVLRDVWASWDFEKQQWVLAGWLDHAHCCDCDNETSVEEVPEGQTFVPVSRK